MNQYSSKTYVLTVGCFDLFHSGHRALLQHMADIGDSLVVGVHSDSSVQELKSARCFDSLEERRAKLRACPKVGEVFSIDGPDPTAELAEVVRKYQSRGDLVYVRGDDMPHFPGSRLIREHRARVIYHPYSTGTSTSQLSARAHELARRLTQLLEDSSPLSIVVPLLEEAITFPSDAVMRLVYKHLYANGKQWLFGKPMRTLATAMEIAWSQPGSVRLIPAFAAQTHCEAISLDGLGYASLNDYFMRAPPQAPSVLEPMTFPRC